MFTKHLKSGGSRLLAALLCCLLLFQVLLEAAPVSATTTHTPTSIGPTAAGFPFNDDFESGILDPNNWTPATAINGVAEINGNYPHSGTQSVFLGQKVGGSASASLSLALDLAPQADQANVFLDFWARANGAGAYRRIFLSDDGGANWKLILELNDTSQKFSHHLLDIASLASANGLTLNNNFRIVFYYASYGSATADPNDGLIIDDLRLTMRAEEIATFPYTLDGFEASGFKPGLYPQSTLGGTAEINGDFAHGGTKSVFLGQKIGGSASAWLSLALDLSGQTDVFLDFWARANGAGAYRKVFLSDDGGTNWKPILELNDTSQNFSHHLLDIASLAIANGLTLNNKFRIIFYYGSYGSATAELNDGLIIDDLRLTMRAQEIAAFPYATDSFETEPFQQGLYPQSTLGGVAEINAAYPHSGVKSVFLGQKVGGSASASLVLALDLSGKTNVFLDFWARANGAGAYRRIFLSDDGGTNWTLVQELNDTSQNFSHHLLDIASLASANGLTLNNKFRIIFYYASYGSATAELNDGLIIDELRIDPQDPTSGLKVFIPLVGR